MYLVTCHHCMQLKCEAPHWHVSESLRDTSGRKEKQGVTRYTHVRQSLSCILQAQLFSKTCIWVFKELILTVMFQLISSQSSLLHYSACSFSYESSVGNGSTFRGAFTCLSSRQSTDAIDACVSVSSGLNRPKGVISLQRHNGEKNVWVDPLRAQLPYRHTQQVDRRKIKMSTLSFRHLHPHTVNSISYEDIALTYSRAPEANSNLNHHHYMPNTNLNSKLTLTLTKHQVSTLHASPCAWPAFLTVKTSV